jgi:IS5 family transposase
MMAGVLEAAFAEIDRQLETKGLILKKGTLLDATLVAAKHAPPARAAGLGATHPREPDASWTKKGGKAYFGYKAQWASTRARGWCAASISPRPRSTTARLPTG